MLTAWRPAQAGREVTDAHADGARALVNPCRDWRTTAICAARASSSRTSAWPACAIWRSCAALSRMPASGASASLRAEASVFVAADLVGVQPIVAVSGLPGFKPSVQPVLATDKVRHVGEAIAVCVADSRAEAEDLAAAVEVDFDELPAVVDMRAALTSETKLHDHWDNNVFLETFVEVASERFSPAGADHRASRSCAQRGNACRRWKAAGSSRRGTDGSSSCWSIPRRRCRTSCGPGWPGAWGWIRRAIRVVAPDVGGGFGYKGILLAGGGVCCVVWRASLAIRCAGSRIVASSLPAMRIAASMTMI